MTIKYLPVLPPNIRPIIKLQDKLVVTTDINFLYTKIINSNNKINKLKKMSVPDPFLNTEKLKLQLAVDQLIKKEKSNKNNMSKIKINLKINNLDKL